jgi:hypothetical protein
MLHRSSKSWLAFLPCEVGAEVDLVLMKLTQTNRSPIWSSTHGIFGVERWEGFTLKSNNVIA